MRRIILASLLLIIGISNTYACSCVLPLSPLEEVDRAGIVFIGEATTSEIINSWTEVGNIAEDKVNFNILYDVKGASMGNVDIITPEDSATCGYDFEVGEKYIVYGNVNEDNEIIVSLCSRTALLENATEDTMTLNIDTSTFTSGTDANNMISNEPNNSEVENNIIQTNDSEMNYKNIYLGLAVLILAIALIILGIRMIKS